MNTIRAGAAACVCALACSSWLACSPEAAHTAWVVKVERSDDLSEHSQIVAWIVRGGCDGDEWVYEAELDGEEAPAAPAGLPPGSYGFAAAVIDDVCGRIAFGCVAAHLPSRGERTVEVLLSPTSQAIHCARSACPLEGCGAVSSDAGLAPPRADPDDSGGVEEAEAATPEEDAGAQDVASGNPDAMTVSDASASDAGSVDDCPGGFRRPQGACYQYVADAMLFAEANMLCLRRGGNVLVIDDSKEEKWILETFAPTANLWLGITDGFLDGWWRTVAGGNLTYTDWDRSPPNPDEGQAASCAIYYVSHGAWRDTPCSRTAAVVCEVPQ